MTLTRREVLEAGLVGAAALALPVCAKAPLGLAKHSLPDAPRPPRRSTVAVVRTADHKDVAAAVRAAVRLAGGLAFVRPGDSVLLKPAVNSGNGYPATTDPETILAVATLVLEAGGKPFVADRTMFLRSTEEAFRKTGILEAARQARIDCVALDDAPTVSLAHPLAENWPDRTLTLYRPVAEADHIINLCTPRTHKLGHVTMSIKNNVGVVAGGKRARMHTGSGFRSRLAEIALVTRPSLIVMDARQGFADGGPDSGDLVRPGLMVAGSDPLAVDAVGVAILRLHGTNDTLSNGSIWEIPILRRAAEIGLGARSASAIQLAGLEEPASLLGKLT